ncbi:MAG: hypothetical protein EXS03_05335 [Phycisphaerales bacterium]|nr:hypothetical protein [Phycisphaerales bacterium]
MPGALRLGRELFEDSFERCERVDPRELHGDRKIWIHAGEVLVGAPAGHHLKSDRLLDEVDRILGGGLVEVDGNLRVHEREEDRGFV